MNYSSSQSALQSLQVPALPALPLRWITKDGRRLLPTQMATSHLHRSVRLLFNHSVPPTFRIAGNIYRLGPHFTSTYRRQCLAQMVPELARRPDLKPWMLLEIQQMQAAIAHLHLDKLP